VFAIGEIRALGSMGLRGVEWPKFICKPHSHYEYAGENVGLRWFNNK